MNDLANAFFCLSLSIASRQLFAFTYRGQQFTYTCLPQGFRDSPGLFNAALCADLHDLELPADVILICDTSNMWMTCCLPHLLLEPVLKPHTLSCQRSQLQATKSRKRKFKCAEVLSHSWDTSSLRAHSDHKSAKLHPQSWKTYYCPTHAGFPGIDRLQQESCAQLCQPDPTSERYVVRSRKQESHCHPHLDARG